MSELHSTPNPHQPLPLEPAATEPAKNLPAIRSVEFEEIARGDREIAITHHGQVYRLRLTRNDRLILQK